MEAIVLAGGLGTRLRSAVSSLPKCLAPIGDSGEPFLGYLLEELERQGVTRVILSVGYLREMVEEWVASRDWPFAIDWAVEEQPLGTGGAIRLALTKAREPRMLVLNGDSFLQVPSLAALLAVEAPIVLSLKPMRDFDRYGSVAVDGEGNVTAFREKAPCAEGLISGGVYAIDRHLFLGHDLPERFSFEEVVLKPMAAAGRVRSLVTDGYFIDIGVPEDYARAQTELPELRRILRASAAIIAAAERGADTLLLDRDGVINRQIAQDYVRRPEQFVFLPGVLPCLAEWARLFPRILVVTNQRGVGKGLMSPGDLEAVHAGMRAAVAAAGGRIDGIYVSTAVSDADPSRKPNPGLFEAARADFPAIDPARTVMAGDSDSDAAFAVSCGVSFVRV